MEDGVHPRLATAASRVSGAPRATSLVNAATPKDTCNRAFFAQCAGAVSLAIIMAVVLFVVYTSVQQRRRKPPTDTHVHPFCCPNEVEEMSRYLNKSVNPCDDFFAYICSSSTTLSHSENTSLDFRLNSAMITGVMPNNVRTAKAGRFLNSFYQTCVKTVSHRESFISSFASALLQEVGDLLNHVDSRTAMLFITTMSFRYSIGSVMHISYQVAEKVIFDIAAICSLDASSLNYLNTALNALKRTTNSTATRTETANLAATLCQEFKGYRRQTAVYHLSNGSSNFSREVWNIYEVEAAMNALGFAFDAKFIIVRAVKEIRLLYDIFTNYSSEDIKAAYLLWQTIVVAIKQLNIHGNSTEFSPQVSETCTHSAFRLFELQDLFKAEILTTPGKDVEARDIFALIKSTVHAQFKRISLIEAEDAEPRDQFFENVRLVTPMEESRASVPVPKATQDFSQNLLKGRRFNHDVNIARLSKFSFVAAPVKYRDLIFLEHRYILLSPRMYDFIRRGPNSLLPNMAILGQLLADSLWSMALNFVKWGPRTTNTIKNFTSCFYDTYTNNAKIRRRFEVLYTSLGMSSVLLALNLTDWHTVQHAWSLWTLSHAQLFYILNSYYRCTNEKSLQTYLEINAPLMYVQDFAKAFKCTENAPMTKPRECRDLD